jgi:2-methylaconitate cis-trans-isomerase PrpF
VRATDLGLDLSRAVPAVLNGDAALRARLERVRASCAVHLGVAGDAATATERSPGVPRLIIVQAPDEDDAASGQAADLRAIATSMGAVHHALPMTGALCMAAAAMLPGTIPNRLRSGFAEGGATVRLRHPKGVVVVTADVDIASAPAVIRSVGVVRTARRLMAGLVYVRTPPACHVV